MDLLIPRIFVIACKIRIFNHSYILSCLRLIIQQVQNKIQRKFNENSTKIQRKFNENSTKIQRKFNENSTVQIKVNVELVTLQGTYRFNDYPLPPIFNLYL